MSDETTPLDNSRKIMAALEPVMERMQAGFGFTDEEIGLALMAGGLNSISKAWSGERVVAHLANLTAAMADMHNIDPETGTAGPPRSTN